MKNNKFFQKFLTLFLTFITVLSFSSQTFAMDLTLEKAEELRKDALNNRSMETAIVEMALSIGDFVMEYLTFLIKEEVTVPKIIYNQVDALNANFFTKSLNSSDSPVTEIVRATVNKWYDFLGKLMIIVYMIALVAVGLRTTLGGVGAKSEAQELFIKWTMGIAIFFFFPYVMRYSFTLNETILRTLGGGYSATVPAGTYIGGTSDLRTEDHELRSPEYVQRGTYILTLGSEDATKAYLNNANKYQENGDMMRLMRALAGVTFRMIYVVIWFVMMWQLLAFVYIYYKRFLMIAFLIAIFPLTLMEYIIGTVTSGKQSALSSWSKEFFVNVFLQSIHAVVYALVSSVMINQVVTNLNSEGINQMNWLVMIIAINFVFTGEKMLRSIISAAVTTVQSPGEAVNEMKGGAAKVKKMIGMK